MRPSICKRTGCFNRCKDNRGTYCSFTCTGLAKRKPLRVCERPGCGQPIHRKQRTRNRWCSRACIDYADVNRKKSYTQRRHRFDAEIKMLADRIITQAQLLAVIARADRRGYQRGWKTRDKGLPMDWQKQTEAA